MGVRRRVVLWWEGGTREEEAWLTLHFSSVRLSRVRFSPLLSFVSGGRLSFTSTATLTATTTLPQPPPPAPSPSYSPPFSLSIHTHTHIWWWRERERELEEERLYNSPCSSASAITSTIPQLCKHYQLSVSSRRRLNQQGEAVQ